MKVAIKLLVLLNIGFSTSGIAQVQVFPPSTQCGECHDALDFCLLSANIQELCNVQFTFSAYVRSVCQKSCGTCTPCKASCNEGDCVDKTPFCTNYKKDGYCGLPHLQSFMKETCAKSCGFCKECLPKEPRCSPDCKDKSPICFHAAKDLQYCNPAHGFEEWMKKTCPMSCNMCNPCTTKLKNETKPGGVVPVPKPYHKTIK